MVLAIGEITDMKKALMEAEFWRAAIEVIQGTDMVAWTRVKRSGWT